MITDWSPAAQAGGAFAAVLGLLAALGKALAWLLNWHGERTDRKSSRLSEWEANLVRREKEYRETLEANLAALQTQVLSLRVDISALGHSLIEVTVELRDLDPDSAALQRATDVLRAAFPPAFDVPHDMKAAARKMDD